MTLDDAHKWSRRVARLAFIVAAVRVLVIAIGFAGRLPDRYSDYGNPYGLIDVILAAACAYGILRYSRFAAISLLVLAVLGQGFSMSHGRGTNLLIVGAMLYVYWKGIRATFAWHRENPEPLPMSSAMRITLAAIGTVATTVVLAIVTFGVLELTGYVPSRRVLIGDDIPERQIQTMREWGILEGEEEPLMFYSAAFWSVLDDGNVLTDLNVISYENQNGYRVMSLVPVDSVMSVEVRRQGEGWEDTVIEVFAFDSTSIILYLSTQDEGDDKFIEALQSIAEQNAGTVESELE